MALDKPGLIARVTLPGAVAAELEDRGQNLPLHPEEVAAVQHAAEKRRRDFAAGRFCARAALAQLGRPARKADATSRKIE